MSAPDPAPYATADTTLLKEIVTLGEARLQAQLTVAIAADQRAMVLCGLLVPTIAALIAGGVALFLATGGDVTVARLAFVAAIGLFVSLVLAIIAAQPSGWYLPGYKPSAFISDIASGKDERMRWAEMAASIDQSASDNSRHLDRGGKLIMAALIVAALTLLICGGYLIWYIG